MTTSKTTGETKHLAAVRALLKHSVLLRDLVDPGVLVNRYELKKEGIDPGSVRVTFTSDDTPSSYPSLHLIILPTRVVDLDSEEVYVILAHELAHFGQELSGKISEEQAEEYSKQHELHADRPNEIDAINWEAMQAAKFEWDTDRYFEFIDRLYPSGLILRRDLTARRLALLPFLGPEGRLRPEAHVRSHRRRV